MRARPIGSDRRVVIMKIPVPSPPDCSIARLVQVRQWLAVAAACGLREPSCVSRRRAASCRALASIPFSSCWRRSDLVRHSAAMQRMGLFKRIRAETRTACALSCKSDSLASFSTRPAAKSKMVQQRQFGGRRIRRDICMCMYLTGNF